MDNHNWERVDAQLELPVSETWKLGYDAVYEPLKGAFSRGNLSISKVFHCRTVAFSYDHVRKNVALQYTINAFPTLPFQWGSATGVSLSIWKMCTTLSVCRKRVRRMVRRRTLALVTVILLVMIFASFFMRRSPSSEESVKAPSSPGIQIGESRLVGRQDGKRQWRLPVNTFTMLVIQSLSGTLTKW